MVETKPLEVTVKNYREGCIKAFEEGKKDLKWLEGVLKASRYNL
jgi:hypothetical protein